jgi:hypothetical protein
MLARFVVLNSTGPLLKDFKLCLQELGVLIRLPLTIQPHPIIIGHLSDLPLLPSTHDPHLQPPSSSFSQSNCSRSQGLDLLPLEFEQTAAKPGILTSPYFHFPNGFHHHQPPPAGQSEIRKVYNVVEAELPKPNSPAVHRPPPLPPLFHPDQQFNHPENSVWPLCSSPAH